MEATTSRTQRITKDYFPWLKGNDPDYCNKPLWNEAAAAMEVFLQERQGHGAFLKDAVQDMLTGWNNNIEDAPFEYCFMLMKLLKALGSPSVQNALKSINSEFTRYEIDLIDLLITFFTELTHSQELRTEVRLNHFLDYPTREDPEKLISEYTALAELQATMKKLHSTQ